MTDRPLKCSYCEAVWQYVEYDDRVESFVVHKVDCPTNKFPKPFLRLYINENLN